MSHLAEYMNAAIGYDDRGLPASTTHFVFGMAPFLMTEDDKVSDVAKAHAMVGTDAVVDIQIIDDLLSLSFDFSAEPDTFEEFATELIKYNEEKSHVMESLNGLMNEMFIAQRNADIKREDEAKASMRNLNVPFLVPTILPVKYEGTVHLAFANDPQFIFFTSDEPGRPAYKVTMVYSAEDLFYQDNVSLDGFDSAEELEARNAELWYAEEMKKMEEEEYREVYGRYWKDDDEDDEPEDKRLKGVRIK